MPLTQAAAARGDFDALRRHYQRNGGTWMGETAEQHENNRLRRIAEGLLTGKSRSGRRDGVQLMQSLQQGQQTGREMSLREMLANPQIAAAHITAQQANRLNTLQQQLTRTNDPAERQRLTEMIRSLSGQATERNAQVIYDEEPVDPAQPYAGVRKFPMVLNRDGTATRVTQRQEPQPLPKGVSRDAALEAARNAIANGFDPAAVAERLQQFSLTLDD